MRRPIMLSLVVATLALGACSKQGDSAGGGKSPEQVGKEAEAAGVPMRPQPGKYRATVKILDVSFPGMNPQMASRMKGMFGASGHSTEFCLTPEQANKGYEEMTKRAAEGNCTYDSFKADAGQLDASMTCQTAKGMTTKATMSGAFTPTGSSLKMTSETSGASLPGGGMHLQAEVVNERIGDCQ